MWWLVLCEPYPKKKSKSNHVQKQPLTNNVRAPIIQKACTCLHHRKVRTTCNTSRNRPTTLLYQPANNTKGLAQITHTKSQLSKVLKKNKMAPRNSRAGPGYARSLLNELSSAENRSVVTAVTMFAVRNPSSSLFICLSYAMRKRMKGNEKKRPSKGRTSKDVRKERIEDILKKKFEAKKRWNSLETDRRWEENEMSKEERNRGLYLTKNMKRREANYVNHRPV